MRDVAYEWVESRMDASSKFHGLGVAACCSLVQWVAVWSSVLQCVAVHCSALQCAAVPCSVLQCVAVCFSALKRVAVSCSVLQCVTVCCSVLQCVVVPCSVLQCIAVPCSVLQCVAVCFSALQWVAACWAYASTLPAISWSQVWVVSHMNESRHMWMRHVTCKWIILRSWMLWHHMNKRDIYMTYPCRITIWDCTLVDTL